MNPWYCDNSETRLFAFADLYGPPDIEKTDTKQGDPHQSALVTEVIQERFPGYNEAEQLKAPRCVVSYHFPDSNKKPTASQERP